LTCVRAILVFLLGTTELVGAALTSQSLSGQEGVLVRTGGHSYSAWLPQADIVALIVDGSMEIRGPIASPEWQTRMTFTGLGRDGRQQRPWEPCSASGSDHDLRWKGNGVDIEYLLENEGLRQNFHVAERMPGTGPLELSLALGTPLCPEVDTNGDLNFRRPGGEIAHTYHGLAVWDACGTMLHAWITVDPDGRYARILVDDQHAKYPITVDPVSTAYDRMLVGTGGQFGRCVSSAGDLNGDGYSDVAVGAYQTAVGGTVYVYYGSASGIGTTPDVTLDCGVVGSNFGLAVDGAGDVNGDGYEDLIVGASAWDNNVSTVAEGAVFVYHGSATGISTTPTYPLQTNTANSYMGSSVAGLGDINGDGYSDIIAGGYLAAYPSSGEGAAWVFLGSATGLNPTFRHRLERNFGSAQFGYAVAGAGDVNGDGYNDVVIGAHKIKEPITAPAVTGGVYVYHGSANALGAGLNPNPTLAFTTTGYSMRNGWSVSSAGDVNGDGYSDIIIGDWQDQIGAEASEGVALIYHGSATGINPTPVTIIEGGASNRYLGRSVSTAGDINGDGYADVVIGCIWWTSGQANEGAVFVHLGSPTGISSSAFLRYEPNAINANLGEWVSTAGDVNGDGYSDMILGAPGHNRAYIYHGGAYSVSTTPAMTRTSPAANALLGTTVANAGDVNGDGYSDAIVGAPGAANGQAGEGLAYLHYGSTTGLSAIPSLTLEANIANAAFGQSVASSGDVNGDGYADVVVGAPQSNGIGQVYVYHGSAAGLGSPPALTLSGTSGSLFGASVFTAGDHNADGYADLLVGAPGSDQVFVYRGTPTGLDPTPVLLSGPVAGSSFGASVCTAGDLNGDGFSDIIVGAPDLSNGQAQEGGFYLYGGALITLPTTPMYGYESNTAGRRLGAAVAGIGDANGDGYYDVAIGAPNASWPEASEGVVYIFYGAPVPSGVLVSTVLHSNTANARMGSSVAEAGDVNGDGYADLITGAPGVSNGEAGEGRAWLFLGSASGLNIANNTILEPNVANEAFGSAVAGGGDVDGDGYSDVLVGSPTSASNQGTVRLFRGNNALAYNRLTRQYMFDLVNPLATNSMDFDDHYFFGIGHRARSPIQRTPGRLRWEVVHEGQPFSGSPITNSVSSSAMSATYTDLGLAGVEIKEVVTKIPSRYRNKWRVRVEYPMHRSIDGQRFSRWFYGYASGVGDIGVLPVTLTTFTGSARMEGNLLEWSTGSERNSAYFIVERGANGLDFAPIGTVEAAGESSTLRSYELLDTNAPEGISYYRLRMVDRTGAEELSDIVVVVRDQKSVVIFPVPVDDAIHWSTTDGSITHLIVRDALGRIVVDAMTEGHMYQGADLGQLASGSYALLLLNANGAPVARARFLKR
jgi:hypothetical protein